MKRGLAAVILVILSGCKTEVPAAVNQRLLFVGPSAKLTWSPPEMGQNGYAKETRSITSGGTLSLDVNTDYVLELPADRALQGPLQIDGGHNIVIIGGEITIASSDPYVDGPRKPLYFKNQTGTVHVEGILTGPSTSDAFSMAAPEATFQIQNCRAEGLHGLPEGAHADLVQPWGGLKILRMDKVTGYSDLQGIYLQQDYNCPGYAGAACDKASHRETTYQEITLKRVNIRSHGNGARQTFWHTDSQDFAVTLLEVWLEPGMYRFGDTVWPNDTFPPGMRAVVAADGMSLSWPGYNLPDGRPQISGQINKGVPANGDFAPADPNRIGGVGVPGYAYVSPGYLSGDDVPPADAGQPAPDSGITPPSDAADTDATSGGGNNPMSDLGTTAPIPVDDDPDLLGGCEMAGTELTAEPLPAWILWMVVLGWLRRRFKLRTGK